MWLSDYEKHNVLSFIRKNSLKQFTKAELIKKMTKSKHVWYGYGESKIENNLQQLVIENKLSVYYISQNNKSVAIYTIINKN